MFIVQPSAVRAGAAISPAVQVAATDNAGMVMTSYTGTITMSLAPNLLGGVLGGTTSVAAVNGIAVFTNLRVDRAGVDYQLQASAPSLSGATSALFIVTP